MPTRRARAGAFALALLASSAPLRAQSADLALTLDARSEKVFDSATDRCEPVDIPDINPRAYRAADGSIVMFALHFQTRALRGPDFGHLKIDCHVALKSAQNPDPATYDGRRYLTATWTPDGKRVAALVHDEYHADHHAGRCLFASDLPCWWNTVLSFRSEDGGANFTPSKPLVVAAAPFTQDVGQGRHRGFFNPSNMFGKDGYVYALTSTTGWEGQEPGPCLIRNRDPQDSAGWRGWDGKAFTVTWSDPYKAKPGAVQKSCQPVAPFGFPVGAVVRHRASGNFLAVWDAPRVPGKFPTTGVYYATSKDLLRWSDPVLLLASNNPHDTCGANDANRDGWVNAYPSLIDHDAQGRNFDDVGDKAWLYVARIQNVGCNPAGRRYLLRMPVSIAAPR